VRDIYAVMSDFNLPLVGQRVAFRRDILQDISLWSAVQGCEFNCTPCNVTKLRENRDEISCWLCRDDEVIENSANQRRTTTSRHKYLRLKKKKRCHDEDFEKRNLVITIKHILFSVLMQYLVLPNI